MIVLSEIKKNGVRHCATKPAIRWIDGNYAWWLNGGVHRYYGPISKSGNWFIHNKFVKRTNHD